MTFRHVAGFVLSAAALIVALWVIALAIVSEPQPESPAANLDRALDAYGGPDIGRPAYARQ